MNEITHRKSFAICLMDEDDHIISKQYLRVKWNPDVREHLMDFHNINFEDEVSEMVLHELRYSIDKESIKKLLRKVKK